MLGTNMLAVAEETATPEKEAMGCFLFRGGFLGRADHLSSQSLSFLLLLLNLCLTNKS